MVRQRQKPPSLALSHNLGGSPIQNVSSIAIVGLEDA
jgi:acetyl-CoA C-acetyltransferase